MNPPRDTLLIATRKDYNVRLANYYARAEEAVRRGQHDEVVEQLRRLANTALDIAQTVERARAEEVRNA